MKCEHARLCEQNRHNEKRLSCRSIAVLLPVTLNSRRPSRSY